MENRIKAFISHDKNDKKIKETIHNHLKILDTNGYLKFWCTEDIKPGEDYEKRMDQELRDVKVAIPLISSDYINLEKESKNISKIINNHQQNGLMLFPILLSSCMWEEIDWLNKEYVNLTPANEKPLDLLNKAKRKTVLTEFGRKIRDLILEQA
ncbi:MAG: toll/interleukin-1 receptor domain-containing protein [Bacteroidota bacterium]